jgi:hypothetical protein
MRDAIDPRARRSSSDALDTERSRAAGNFLFSRDRAALQRIAASGRFVHDANRPILYASLGVLTMKTRLSLMALAISFASVGASAQAATAAAGGYKWIPAGEGIPGELAPPSTASTTTREAVKAQTLAARRSGALRTAGEAAEENAERGELAAPSTQSRAEVRAATLEAVREGTIAPFGETAGAE